MTTLHCGDITNECVECALTHLPDSMNAVRILGEIQHDTTDGVEWWAAYVIHEDGSRGWQLTTDGITFVPRENLPVAR